MTKVNLTDDVAIVIYKAKTKGTNKGKAMPERTALCLNGLGA